MIATQDRISDLLPLREPTFFILLSLAPGEKHGYAILKDVEALSDGRIRLSTGTLYEALARLLEQGLIERISGSTIQVGERQGVEPDDSMDRQAGPGRPRKAYRLTRVGRRLLAAETSRLQTLVAAARRRLGEELS